MADLRKWNKLSKDNISPGQKLIIGFLVSPEANNIVQNTEPEVKQPVVEEKKEAVTTNEESSSSTKEEPKKQEMEKQEPEKKITPPVNTEVSSVTTNNGSGGYFKSQFDLQIKTQPIKSDQTASARIQLTASSLEKTLPARARWRQARQPHAACPVVG